MSTTKNEVPRSRIIEGLISINTHKDKMNKSDMPPLPARRRTPYKLHDRTIRTTAPFSRSSSFSEYTFQTPQTKTSSPGMYDTEVWPLLSHVQEPKTKIIIEGIPKFTISPSRRIISKSLSSSCKRSPLPILRHHSSPSQTFISPVNIRQSPLHWPLRLERKESILDLTDSEDENESVIDEGDSVIDDHSLQKLIRVTSNTMSKLEKEKLVELHPYRIDLEDYGIDKELKQLQHSENTFHSQISFEVDEVAYGKESTTDLNKKLSSSRSNKVYKSLPKKKNTPAEEEDSTGSSNMIRLCICCGDA